ncbi:AraC family transcriptional regulator [Victivallis vadensis]|uniref:AraC family transcriptional regulator n=1 Tax=Victivallis vadensis TaxID=172901 RepID=UPI0034661FA7
MLCTRQSVKQISAGLYFSNEYYFAGLFKKKTGLSPGRYRRKTEEGTLTDFNIIESEPGHYVNRALLASESD